MKFQYHAIASIALSGILYLIFKSWAMAAACLITGIFIDLDYIVDYFTQCGFSLNIKKFIQFYDREPSLKMRLFHGWEWLLLWGAAAWLTNGNPWIVGTLIGFGQHLLLDKINFGEPFLSYSVLWRWKKRFRSAEIFRRKKRRDFFSF